MNSKKILSCLVFLGLILNTVGCLCGFAATDIENQQKQVRAKINKLKWLESVETNKLYKIQQKQEHAEANLSKSESEVNDLKRRLSSLDTQLSVAYSEYNNLNLILAVHLRKVYKAQRKAILQMILSAEDINMLVDRIYYQKVLLKGDYDRMAAAKNKAAEIANLRNSIRMNKYNLECSIASINSQMDYIKRAEAKHKSMINKLQTDRIAYQKAERDLAMQSQRIGSYINKTTKHDTIANIPASGFVKPIAGRITSPYGWRTHPIFNSRSFHSGIDIGGPNLGAIRASNSGKVIYSGWYGGYGKVVIVEHGVINGKPITTLYAHMSSIAVSNGTNVKKGDVLGYEGSTGYSTGPHCHFEVRVNGKTDNPLNYL